MKTRIYKDRFLILGNVSETPMWIFYDKETKVMYLTYGNSGSVGICVMVDENGKPLLYEEK